MAMQIIPAPAVASILAVAAHPDDIESWCAGTLALAIDAGATVRLLLVTSGEHGSSDPQATPAAVARQREQEAGAAALELGLAEVAFLRYSDGEVEDTRALRGDLVAAIRRWRPDVLFTHDPEQPWPPYLTHRDHRIVGRAALDASTRSPATTWPSRSSASPAWSRTRLAQSGCSPAPPPIALSISQPGSSARLRRGWPTAARRPIRLRCLLAGGNAPRGSARRPAWPWRKPLRCSMPAEPSAVGPRWLRRMLLALAVSIVGTALQATPQQILPALAGSVWGADARVYGLLAALPGLGAIMAAGLVTWRLRSHHQLPWESGAALLGSALIGLGFITNAGVAGGLLMLTGFAATFAMTVVNATLQTVTPDALRGRMMSLYTWLAAGMPALGAWLVGSELRGLGFPTAISSTGACYCWRYSRLRSSGRVKCAR